MCTTVTMTTTNTLLLLISGFFEQRAIFQGRTVSKACLLRKLGEYSVGLYIKTPRKIAHAVQRSLKSTVLEYHHTVSVSSSLTCPLVHPG